MKSMKAGTMGLVLLAAAALCTGCPGLRPAEPVRQASAIVWPAAPQTPRIRFLRTLAVPEDLGVRPGLWRRMRSAIKGVPRSRIVAPHGIHMSADGRLYVVDTFLRAVHVFDTRNSTYYQFPRQPLDGLIYPTAITSADDGRVYLSDPHAQAVHVFENHGKSYVRAVGKELLQRPTGLVVDHGRDELLVVDSLASRIVTFDLSSLEQKTSIGRDGRDEGSFHFPVGIALSADGLFYLLDSMNFRVQVFDHDFRFLRSFGHAGIVPGSFSRPKGVAVDSDGHVYVVDALFDNVQIFDRDGRLLMAFGSPGQAPGEFWLPNAICIDDADRIYVSDSYNRRVQVFQYLNPSAGS